MSSWTPWPLGSVAWSALGSRQMKIDRLPSEVQGGFAHVCGFVYIISTDITTGVGETVEGYENAALLQQISMGQTAGCPIIAEMDGLALGAAAWSLGRKPREPAQVAASSTNQVSRYAIWVPQHGDGLGILPRFDESLRSAEAYRTGKIQLGFSNAQGSGQMASIGAGTINVSSNSYVEVIALVTGRPQVHMGPAVIYEQSDLTGAQVTFNPSGRVLTMLLAPADRDTTGYTSATLKKGGCDFSGVTPVQAAAGWNLMAADGNNEGQLQLGNTASDCPEWFSLIGYTPAGRLSRSPAFPSVQISTSGSVTSQRVVSVQLVQDESAIKAVENRTGESLEPVADAAGDNGRLVDVIDELPRESPSQIEQTGPGFTEVFVDDAAVADLAGPGVELGAPL